MKKDDGGYYPTDIAIHGYGKIGNRFCDEGAYHGRMAMSQCHFAVMANEINPTVWVFKIGDCANHQKLDRHHGHIQAFDEPYQDDELNDEDQYYRNRPGRQIAVGKVEFPRWGGIKPQRKKLKPQDFCFDISKISKGEKEEDDGFGDGGGPIAIAMRGRGIVAGFSNGTSIKALLPQELEETPTSVSSNHLTSSSYLQSDMFFTPQLEFEGMDESGSKDDYIDDDDFFDDSYE
ncbi:hypothetical protein HJC23_000121 [Cyclotella cryptica]|uniref:Uncharacterized protein n=1 Tax=Cyclotella cryptica TaxID=29204 RepID=A0ABD3P043_9STRA